MSSEDFLIDREYRHRHIDIDIDKEERRKKKEKRFYVPYTFEPILFKMEKILSRDGVSLSEWIRDSIDHYVRLHEPGNPQQTLTTIMEIGKPYRADECLECGKKPFVEAVKDGRVKLLCKTCFQRLRHKLDGWKEV